MSGLRPIVMLRCPECDTLQKAGEPCPNCKRPIDYPPIDNCPRCNRPKVEGEACTYCGYRGEK